MNTEGLASEDNIGQCTLVEPYLHIDSIILCSLLNMKMIKIVLFSRNKDEDLELGKDLHLRNTNPG